MSALSRYFALFNPVRAIRDFRDVWMQENPYRWRIALVAAVATISIFSIMFQEEQRVEPKPPEITWVKTLDPSRSDAEIMASNIENQKEKDQLRAEQEARDAKVREVYEAIGRASGMDVEAAREKGEAERAARAAEEQAAREKALAGVAETESNGDGN